MSLQPTTSASQPAANAESLGGDFRLLLERELAKRCEQNSRYSLRAFAKFLGLDSSRLSKILRGERPVSARLTRELGQRLGLSQREILQYLNSAAARVHSLPLELKPEPRYEPLALDLFECIEDWRHYAILELLKVQDFEANEKWLAKRLNASVPEIRACVSRLRRAGLLVVTENGEWRDTSQGFSTHILSDTETSYAHRRSQKKILELASSALDEVPIQRRDQSSMMMATSAAKIAEAKLRIARFRRELCAFLEDVEEKDSIFQLSVSLFPLDEKSEKVSRSKKKLTPRRMI